MGVNVTKNVTTVVAENGTTIEVTKDVTNVAVADGTATLTVNPSQTVVNVSGNTSSIDVVAQPQSIRLIDDAYVASEGNSTITDGTLDILAGSDKVANEPVLGLHTKTAHCPFHRYEKPLWLITHHQLQSMRVLLLAQLHYLFQQYHI